MRKKKGKGPGQGMTLIELVITLVFVFILVGMLALLYQAGFSTAFNQSNRMVEKGTSSRALILVGQELRQATAITSAQLRSLSFTADPDFNGAEETLQYTWSGTAGESFNRVSTSTTPLVPNVTALSFSYYNAGNALLSFPVTASQVRLVALDMTVTDGDETFQLRNQIRPRNL